MRYARKQNANAFFHSKRYLVVDEACSTSVNGFEQSICGWLLFSQQRRLRLVPWTVSSQRSMTTSTIFKIQSILISSSRGLTRSTERPGTRAALARRYGG